MNIYSLVLAGGGGKGAYQIGAWRALRELGVSFDAIAGVSVGSINGALIAAGDYEKAVEMWNNVSLDKGVKINEELPDPDNLFSKKNWPALFREFMKNGGIDASPAREFVSQYIDEEKVRQSGIILGVVAVQVNQGMTPVEVFLEDMAQGELLEYLLASSSVPLTTNLLTEGEKYLDGGVYDNTPVLTLKKRGYNRLVVLDISNIKGVAHNLDFLNSQVVYVRPYDLEDLGATFDFSKEIIEKRMILGYLDTRKAFSLLSGKIYYFMPDVFRNMVKKYGADRIVNLEELAHELKVPKTEIYSEEEFILKTKELYEERKLKEAESENTEQSEETAVQEIQTEKEHRSDVIASLRKRFAKQKNELESLADATALLDNYII